MTGDGEQRDVRESLGNLERRLLDLERELRTDASEDATVAAGAPAPPAKGKGKRAERAAVVLDDRLGGLAQPVGRAGQAVERVAQRGDLRPRVLGEEVDVGRRRRGCGDASAALLGRGSRALGALALALGRRVGRTPTEVAEIAVEILGG